MKQYGLLGEVLGHSLSPRIHGRIFDSVKVDGRYDLYEVPHDTVGEWMGGQALSLEGFNVTIPYKETVIPYLSEISPQAKSVGAVNTVAVKAGKLYGHNTDYYGFGEMLGVEGIEVKGARVLVLGTGGAAKAVSAYLLDAGAGELTLASVDVPADILRFPGSRVISHDEIEALGERDILVNCTPVGMHPHTGDSLIGEDLIGRFTSVVDLIYNPWETELLRLAANAGKKAINGLYMLVAQAVRAEEIWQGVDIPKEITRDIYNELKKQMLGDRLNIVLTGMMGSGKSALGYRAAMALGRMFIDMDAWIEERHGPIPELFKKGEGFFRDIETEAARQIGGLEGAVIATGGGVVLRQENMDALGRQGIVLFIDRPVDQILTDIDTDHRPLLQEGKEKLNTIYRERERLYRGTADYVIDNSGTAEEALNNIIAAAKGE